jgi:CubicO group peptidase (beta-lactamase class C family)
MRFRYLLLLPLLAGHAFAQDLSKEIVVPGMGAKLDDYMERLSAFDYSGTVLVQYKGQIILNKGYGYADRAHHIRNRPDTVFEIGSLAKQFTATEIMLLVRAGKVHLDDSVGLYLTEAPDWLKKVTVRNLLNHTGGIPNEFGYKEVVKKDEMLKRIYADQPKFAPGEKFQYSNEGFVLLACIIEKVTGRDFDNVAHDDLFVPAGMMSTGFLGERMAHVNPRRLALGYDDAGVTYNLRKADWDDYSGVGCGNLTTDLPDLFRWYETIFQRGFLTDQEKSQMFKPALPLDKPVATWFSGSYGFGWFIQPQPDGKMRIQHGGDGYGFGSQFTWYPHEQLLVLALCNTRHDVFPDIIRGGRAMSQIILGEDHAEPPAVRKVPAVWSPLLGSYRLDTGDVVTIYRNGENVMIGADGQAAASLLDQEPADELAQVQAQELVNKASIPRLFARDKEFWKKLQANGAFVDGVNDEITAYGKKLGKPLGARSLGTYEGGFADFASIWDIQFEKGTLPYKISWNANAIRATWTDSPPLASPIPLQVGQDGNLVGWNLCTKRGFTIKAIGNRLEIERPNAKGVGTRMPGHKTL